MILPIYAYGQPVLKQVAEDITKDYPALDTLIANMWETLKKANGVGLAAPQIGLPIRLFIVDTSETEEAQEKGNGIKKVFINAEMIEESGKKWSYTEGCLSIPDITGDVFRLPNIEITYYDENFKFHSETFDGLNARVIQHEYDHIEGILFLDYLKPLKRRRLKRKLENIKKGITDAKYKLKFYEPKKGRK